MQERTFKNIIAYLFVFLIVALPAVFSTKFYSSFAAPKLFLLHLVTSIAVLLTGYYLIASKKVAFNYSKWLKYLLIYLVLSFFSGIFSINVFSSFFGVEGRFIGTFTLLHIGILSGIFVGFFPQEKIPLILKSFLIATTFTAIYSLLQHFELISTETKWALDPTKRSFGTLGHANHLGAYLATAIVLAIPLIGYLEKKSHKIVAAGSIIILFAALITTASRGAFLALIITLFFLALFSKKNKEILIGIIILGISSAFLIPSFKEEISKIPLIERSIESIESYEEGNIPDRLTWWKSSLQMVQDYPILGTGIGTFKDAYNSYRSADYKLPDNIQNKITPESAHNELINIWATQGTLGLISFIFVLIFPIIFLIQKLREKKLFEQKSKYLALATLGGISIYTLQTLLSFGVLSTLTIFYIFLSLAALFSEENKNIYINLEKSSQKILALSIIVAFATSSLYLGTKRIKAEYFLQEAKSSVLAESIESNHQKAILNFPWEYTYYSSFADYNLEAIIQQRPDINFNRYINFAITNYEKALRLNDHHPVTHGNYGIALLTYAKYQQELGKEDQYQKFLDKGKKAFEKAIEKGPNNPIFKEHYEKALDKLDQKEAK